MKNKQITVGRLREIVKEELERLRVPVVKLGARQIRALVMEMVGDDEEPEDITKASQTRDEMSLFSMLSPNDKRRPKKSEREPGRKVYAAGTSPLSRSRQMDIEDRKAADRAKSARLQKIKDRDTLRQNGIELDKLRDPAMQSAAYRRRLRQAEQNNDE